MLNNTTRKTINIDKTNLSPLWTFKQEDDGVILLSLFKNSTALDITGQTVKLGIKRPNGTLVNIEASEGDNPFTIVSNNLDIKLKNSALAIPGLLECDLELVDVNGKMTTASFFITVSKKVVGETNIAATNEIPSLEKLKSDFQTDVNNIKAEYDSFKRAQLEVDKVTYFQNEVNKTNAHIAENTQQIKQLQSDIGTTANIAELKAINNEATQKITELDDKINQVGDISNTIENVEDAKKDFNGKTHNNLKEAIDSNMSYVNDRFNNASLLEYDNKYISANESYDGFTKELKIKGRTLKNLSKQKSAIANGGCVVTEVSNEFNIKTNGMIDATLSIEFDLKPDTEYTIITNVTKNTLNAPLRCDTNTIFPFSSASTVISPALQTGVFKYKYKSQSTMTTTLQKLKISNGSNIVEWQGSIIILEGDYTNESINYFEGIKSAGEEGFFDIVSCGKNLIDNSIDFEKVIYRENNKYIIPSGTSVGWYGLNKPIKLKANTQYTFSFPGFSDCGARIALSYAPGTFSATNNPSNIYVNIRKDKYTFTTNDNSYIYLAICTDGIYSNTKPMVEFNLQLEEGANVTEYEIYKKSIIGCQLDEQLRSLPNGVKDEMDLEKGKLIKQIGKMVLSGSENWKLTATQLTNTVTAYLDIKGKQNGFCISDKFSTVTNQTDYTSYDNEFIQSLTSSVNFTRIALRILKTKLLTQDIAGFKAWLQANPTTIYYELEAPIETTIDIINNLRTYDGTTNIFTQGSLIEPNIYCKVPSDVITALDTRQSTVKGKLFSSADARLEEIEQDVKNIVTPSEWITPTLTNGWVNFGDTKSTLQYMKDRLGFVHLKGQIKNGVATAAFANVPAGYRPLQELKIPIINGTSVKTLTILPAGFLVSYDATTNTMLSVDGVTFRAEQ